MIPLIITLTLCLYFALDLLCGYVITGARPEPFNPDQQGDGWDTDNV